MYRANQAYLNHWWLNPHRKPLILRGARQVGKSTLVRNFAQELKLPLVEINLERHRDLNPIFQSLDIKRILAELESIAGQSICEDGLLFLDEIQATPDALAALRYFYEDRPKLAVIAAGSLLEFVLKDHSFSMPVGRIEYLHLGPMSFKEFLMAAKEDYLLEKLSRYELGDPFPINFFKQLIERQRQFYFIGGMPEAVKTFTETNSFQETARIQETIVSTYIDDFAKYKTSYSDLINLQTVFKFIPRNLGKKIIYAHISKEEKSIHIKKALQLLSMAKIIAPVYLSHCNGIPLGAEADFNFYKCIALDIGLVNRVAQLDWHAISTLSTQKLVDAGGLAEQFIGQHLLYQDGKEYELYYWAREGRSTNAEVDYVVSHGAWIIPIEVKAAQSGTLKSLHQFYYLKKPPLAVRFDLNPPSLQSFTHPLRVETKQISLTYQLLSLPIPMVTELNRIIQSIKTR